MLHHFLSKEVDELPTERLFTNLKISTYLSDINYKKYQGTHPVILVTFKDLSSDNFKSIEDKIKDRISV
jgi:hypothetical protein